MDTNKCSAFLKRLVERGVVAIEGGSPRRRQYYLAERLYNIYYLLRRPSGEGQAVRALIQFMSSCYSPGQLLELGILIAREYQVSDAQLKQLQKLAFSSLLQLPEMQRIQDKLLTNVEVMSRFSSDETPDIALQIASQLFACASDLEDESRTEDALDAYTHAIERFRDSQFLPIAGLASLCLLRKGMLLRECDRSEEARPMFDEVVTTFYEQEDPLVAGTVNFSLSFQAIHLFEESRFTEGIERLEAGLARFENAWESFPGANCLITLSAGLAQQGEINGALEQLDRALSVCGTLDEELAADLVVTAIGLKGLLLYRLGRAISGEDAELLLKHLASSDELSGDTIRTLIWFSAQVGPAPALELIQKSPSSDLLLPLVTALKWEMGEHPRVALEVEEVAKDVRERISAAKNAMMGSGRS